MSEIINEIITIFLVCIIIIIIVYVCSNAPFDTKYENRHENKHKKSYHTRGIYTPSPSTWNEIEHINQNENITRENSYIDEYGYLRWNENNRLCHRDIARTYYHKRYDEMRDKQVHHKNGNKLDNRPENLQILSEISHWEHHNILFKDGEKYIRVAKQYNQYQTRDAIKIRGIWIPLSCVQFENGNIYVIEWFYNQHQI